MKKKADPKQKAPVQKVKSPSKAVQAEKTASAQPIPAHAKASPVVVPQAPAAEAPKPVVDEEIILTDAEGRRLCRVRDCDQASVVEGYCRFHYLLLWKKIQIRKKIIEDGKLAKYVEDLTSRYPDKFLEMIRKDLRSEKDFLAAIAELEIDESGLDNDFEDEIQNDIEEVRGVASESGGSLSDEDVY